MCWARTFVTGWSIDGISLWFFLELGKWRLAPTLICLSSTNVVLKAWRIPGTGLQLTSEDQSPTVKRRKAAVVK